MVAVPPTALVVDDTTSIRFLIRTNLELAGFEVIEATDGQDCLDVLTGLETLPDVITMDMVMPRMDVWFYSMMLGGLERGLRAEGMDVLVYQVPGPAERGAFVRDLPARRKVDAVVLAALPLSPEQRDRLDLLGVPLVIAGGAARGPGELGGTSAGEAVGRGGAHDLGDRGGLLAVGNLVRVEHVAHDDADVVRRSGAQRELDELVGAFIDVGGGR